MYLNVKSKTVKLLEENIGIGKDFLRHKRANHKRLVNITILQSNLFIKRHYKKVKR